MATNPERKNRSDSNVKINQENKEFYSGYFWRALHDEKNSFQNRLKNNASLIQATQAFADWGLNLNNSTSIERLECWINAYINKAGRSAAKNAYRQHNHRMRQQQGVRATQRKRAVMVSGEDYSELRRIATSQGITVEKVLALIMQQVRNPGF